MTILKLQRSHCGRGGIHRPGSDLSVSFVFENKLRGRITFYISPRLADRMNVKLGMRVSAEFDNATNRLRVKIDEQAGNLLRGHNHGRGDFLVSFSVKREDALNVGFSERIPRYFSLVGVDGGVAVFSETGVEATNGR